MGVALQSQQRLDEAINSYETAVKHRPHYADAYNNMGYALQSKGDYQAAIKAYEEAVRLRPDFASARANLRHAKRKLEGGGAKSVVIEVSEDNGAAAPAPAAPARPVKPPLPKQKSLFNSMFGSSGSSSWY